MHLRYITLWNWRDRFMNKLGVFLMASTLAVQVLAQELARNGDTGQSVGQSETTLVLNLADVVREALEKNPAVQSARHGVEAQKHKIPQAKSLPDPEASVGWMGNLTPFSLQEGDPSSYRSIGVMQSIPYPGKLKLRGDI